MKKVPVIVTHIHIYRNYVFQYHSYMQDIHQKLNTNSSKTLAYRNGSQIFLSQDHFMLLKFIEDPKDFVFICHISIDLPYQKWKLIKI